MADRNLAVTGAASLGAGFIHAIAAGTHADHLPAAAAMGSLAAVQLIVGALIISRPGLWVQRATAAIHLIALGGWVATRSTGIGIIEGLDTAESMQVADTLAAALAAIAVIGLWAPSRRFLGAMTMTYAAPAVALLVLPATVATLQHDHSHGHGDTASWPRPYLPGLGIDIAGVEGVSVEQEARARQLVVDTQRELVRWADYRDAIRDGWTSIGDGATGYEHFVNGRALNDGRFLDASMPESIVYKVYGDTRIIVSAMYMAEGQPAIDDPDLVDFAGPLMQWHVHDDLCWTIRDGIRAVAGVIDDQGQCPAGSVRGGITKPMVHVWIVPHPCGPFAAVEGLAEGRAAVADTERVDTCDHEH